MVFGLVFVLIVAAAIGTIVYTGTNTYYVGFDGQNVSIYQGRPGGVLWIDPQVQERTDITRAEVPEGLLDELDAGKQQPDLADGPPVRHQHRDADRHDRHDHTDHSGSALGRARRPATTADLTHRVDLDGQSPQHRARSASSLVIVIVGGAYMLAGLGADVDAAGQHRPVPRHRARAHADRATSPCGGWRPTPTRCCCRWPRCSTASATS